MITHAQSRKLNSSLPYILPPTRNTDLPVETSDWQNNSLRQVGLADSVVGDPPPIGQRSLKAPQGSAYQNEQTDQNDRYDLADQFACILTQMVLDNPDCLPRLMLLIFQGTLRQYLAEQLQSTLSQALRYTQPYGMKPQDWESLLRNQK